MARDVTRQNFLSADESFLDAYRRDVERELQTGVATEHSYRSALKALVEAVGDVIAINEPRRSECGAPDFTIWRQEPHGFSTLGYIEAKDVGVPLAAAERSEQLRRYFPALENLVLTDYLEFRWYVEGDLRRTARLGNRVGDRLRLAPSGPGAVAALLRDFLAQTPPPIKHPADLAKRMARLTHLIRDVTLASFDAGVVSQPVLDLRTAFADVLVPDLSLADFSDMFAQTIAYGLFAARVNHSGAHGFRRHDAAYEIPRTNPFLRRLFGAITGPDLDGEPYVGLVDDLTNLLSATDVDSVLADFGTRGVREDPVVHFYETFLAAYDPALRETRGVYYTPEPVVSFIVRAIDLLLREQFGCRDGMAEQIVRPIEEQSHEGDAPRVLILDPACGTGTFLYAVVDLIREQFRRENNAGKWSAYVREQLLPRLFGFELLMAPYAVAHLKLALQLGAHDLPEGQRRDWAYDFEGDERVGVYLTNTLDEAVKRSDIILGSYLTEEANAAAQIKHELPIMVVLGNPPYSGASSNRGEWIEALMEDYKSTVRSEERQIQRLSNDYVKFFRFAQWRVERTGQGILGFITDHGYLENVLFRDMRASVLKSFSDVFVLNLHGVALRGAAAARPDENVFDITQGVAISIFVKHAGRPPATSIHYADLRGSRESKYRVLSAAGLKSIDWQRVSPRAPQWRFIPTTEDEAYESWPSLIALIGSGSKKVDRDARFGAGVKTRHDKFVVGWSCTDAVTNVQRLANRSETDAELTHELGLCTTSHFNIQRARERAAASDLGDHVEPISYRPFDQRFVVYLRDFVCEPKTELMRHLLVPENLALAFLRRDRRELASGFLVARGLIGKDMISNLDDAVVWPLYFETREPPSGQLQLEFADTGLSPNIPEHVIADLEARLNLEFIPHGSGDCISTFGPEDFLSYVYAILYAPSYRDRYQEFLCRDFPHIPLPTDAVVFRELVGHGRELISAHLLESTSPSRRVTQYPVPGTDEVSPGYPRFVCPPKDAAGRLYINDEQYFDNVPLAVWRLHVGAYQVCEKWLKDRRGLKLNLDDINRFEDVVAALTRTLEITDEIDLSSRLWRHEPAPNADQLYLDLLRNLRGEERVSVSGAGPALP